MSWMNKVLAFFVAKVRARTSMEGYKAIGGGSPQLATTIQQVLAMPGVGARIASVRLGVGLGWRTLDISLAL